MRFHFMFHLWLPWYSQLLGHPMSALNLLQVRGYKIPKSQKAARDGGELAWGSPLSALVCSSLLYRQGMWIQHTSGTSSVRVLLGGVGRRAPLFPAVLNKRGEMTSLRFPHPLIIMVSEIISSTIQLSRAT